MNHHQNHNYCNNQDVKHWIEWNEQMVKKYHSEGTLFESKNPILRTLEKWRVNKIINFAQIKPTDIILDLGCGEGFLISIIKKYREITGIDVSQFMIKKAQERLKNKKNIKLILDDAQNLNMADQSFDKIICSETLEHLPNPLRALQEIHRVLKDSGILVISIPDEKRIENIMKFIKFFKLDKFLHASRKQETYEWHLHHFNKKMIKNLCHNLFAINKITRIPPFIGYRFVVQLKKI